MRVGVGFDAHAFAAGRRLMLGGVEIEHEQGLAGHSDGDCVSHAVADALLGAAALGDLGARFPATDEWRDASSLQILRATRRLLDDAGCSIVNVDVTAVAQSPRLAAYLAQMISNIAAALGVQDRDVSIKATTTDRLGFTGRGEGIAAIAVVLVDPGRSH